MIVYNATYLWNKLALQGLVEDKIHELTSLDSAKKIQESLHDDVTAQHLLL